MTHDQSTLYNKFHIIAIGLKRVERFINHNDNKKAKEIIQKLMEESDEGMAKIEEFDLGWIGG